MSGRLAGLVRGDHRRLRLMADELREKCGREGLIEGDCFRRFRQMKAFYGAQSKAEEYTFYAYLEEGPADEQPDVLVLLFEGYEEHDLADLILKEMGQAEELSIEWRAKLNVFIALIQHHMEKEEREFLPKGLSLLDADIEGRLTEDYERERDQLFAKKSGLSAPAASIYVTNSLSNH